VGESRGSGALEFVLGAQKIGEQPGLLTDRF
jgi:hypothetical protein